MASEKRLIDANALEAKIERVFRKLVSNQSRPELAAALSYVGDLVIEAPTVDAFEIPDCKKCAFNYTIAWHQCEHCLGEAVNNFVPIEEVKHGE
jgi:hypothetical protein